SLKWFKAGSTCSEWPIMDVKPTDASPHPSPTSGEGPGEGSTKISEETFSLTPALSREGRGGTALTPLMRQYHELKARYPEELLFFRLGDFFELFDEDARRAAPILEVALTHRQQVPMCGVPAHAVDPYVAKLLRAGFRVAIADQLEDPGSAKGIVKRDVVRVMTAGTLREDTLLSSGRCNFLVAVAQGGGRAGIAAVECSTGAFMATELDQTYPASALWDEIIRLAPSEVLLEASEAGRTLKVKLQKQHIAVAELPPQDFAELVAQERL